MLSPTSSILVPLLSHLFGIGRLGIRCGVVFTSMSREDSSQRSSNNHLPPTKCSHRMKRGDLLSRCDDSDLGTSGGSEAQVSE
jgi:hypothetical protein